MNFREPRDEEPVELSLVSLVDVVFTLLLFFVLTTTFRDRADITLTLPRADSAVEAEARDDIEITVDAEGRYYIQGQALVNAAPETLKRALAEAVGERTEPLVVVAADGATPHQAVVTAMDVARQLGIGRLTIATSPAAAPVSEPPAGVAPPAAEPAAGDAPAP